MGGGQIGIVAEIELCGSGFDLGDDELLDRVETDRAESDGVHRCGGNHGFGKDLHQPQRLDELAFAAIAHAGFQESPQMLERFRKCPVLQGSRLVQGAGLLLEERQIVLRVKDELTTAIDARMPGDLARAADDRDLVDEALDQDVAKTIGRRHGIIVHAIAYQRGRGDLARALVARLEGRLGQSPQDRLIRDKPFASVRGGRRARLAGRGSVLPERR